jgi:protein phosphatase 1L
MCSMCSENKKFSYGYSSVRGKRASMEDFHDTKISEVNGEMVGLFGVFDGQYYRSALMDYLERQSFLGIYT